MLKWGVLIVLLMIGGNGCGCYSHSVHLKFEYHEELTPEDVEVEEHSLKVRKPGGKLELEDNE